MRLFNRRHHQEWSPNPPPEEVIALAYSKVSKEGVRDAAYQHGTYNVSIGLAYHLTYGGEVCSIRIHTCDAPAWVWLILIDKGGKVISQDWKA